MSILAKHHLKDKEPLFEWLIRIDKVCDPILRCIQNAVIEYERGSMMGYRQERRPRDTRITWGGYDRRSETGLQLPRLSSNRWSSDYEDHQWF